MDELEKKVEAFKQNICDSADFFRRDVGARNVEIIVSMSENKEKIDVTIRY